MCANRGARRRAPRQPADRPGARAARPRTLSWPSIAVDQRACGRPRRGSVAAVLPHWSHDDGRLPEGRLIRPLPPPADTGHGIDIGHELASDAASGRIGCCWPGLPCAAWPSPGARRTQQARRGHPTGCTPAMRRRGHVCSSCRLHEIENASADVNISPTRYRRIAHTALHNRPQNMRWSSRGYIIRPYVWSCRNTDLALGPPGGGPQSGETVRREGGS